MRKFITILSAALAVTLFLHMDVQAADTINTIEKGVYIGDIDVSGMTALEAEAAVNSYVDSLKSKEITCNALNNNTVTVTAGDLGIKWQNKEVVQQAEQLGKSGNIVQRYKALKDLEHQNEIFPLEISFDEAMIRSVINDQCLQYNVEAIDGTLTREDGEFKYVAGQTGVEINVDASVKAIREYLSDEWDKENAMIDLVAETTQPRGTEEELSMVKDVLGTFTTSFSSSGYNRSGNVRNGCAKINGTLLYPGDTFSTYETVSPFTEANGYFQAGSYLNGLVVDSLGGGICQVSTTLYNAVLLAELEVTERFNHSMIVTYVDPSADAAISGTAKDFKFVNNLSYPVYIEGTTTEDKKVTFTIYGCETRDANREVTYESVVISQTVPEGERIVADSGQPAGFIDVQSAHIGYVAELWKIVKVDGVEESREQVNGSRYTASPRTASVGTATDNPLIAAAINAAIMTGSIDQCRATAGAIGAGNYNDPAVTVLAAQQAALAAQQAQQQAAQQAQQEAPAQ
ncbi:MAG: VanW family protein [Lachnospiraceae bacterium]|nr:VanW family protein [Lachnospiraceae bacterium]